jgi:predicted permease
MGWREARALASVAYRELTFQAIYALRQGNVLPASDAAALVRSTNRRVLQSKLLVGALLGLMGLAGAFALSPTLQHLLGPTAPTPVYRASVLAGVLLLQLSLLWTTGLQILPAFLSSRILPTLETLPAEPRDLDRAAFLLFLRLFDAPAIAIVTVTPVAVALVLGSPLAGLAMVPGALSVVLLAFGLSLATGDFFVRRVVGSPTGAASTTLRWAFLVLWAVPAFAIYVFISFSPEFLRTVAGLAANNPAGLTGLLVIFPFPYAVLPSLASSLATAGVLGLDPSEVIAVLIAALGYAVLLGLVGSWLLRAPRRMALGVTEGSAPRLPSRAPLATGGAVAALLRKDLRTASRSPGFAFVVLLPILDAVVIGLATFVGNPSEESVFNLGSAAVATAALLATFFGPAFFATEVMGYSYTRTLPLSNRTLLAGKVSLVLLIYLIAAAVIFAFTVARVFAPWVFLAFALGEMPALVAAALLELGILFRVSAKRGLAITNLYTGAWWGTVVVIPGVIVAALPLGVFHFSGGGTHGIAAMALVALLEVGVIVPIALRWSRWGSA